MKCIYLLENKVNKKVYVGQTKNLKERIRGHKKQSKNSNHSSYNYELYKDIRLFGWENFKFIVLEECEDEHSYEFEQNWIDFFENKKMCYNRSKYARVQNDPKNHLKGLKELIKHNHGKRKKVQQFSLDGNLLATYEGVREAGRITKVSHHTIQKVANGDKHRKTGGGYIWKYVSE